MPPRQGLLHAPLPRQQPIHRLVERVLVGVGDAEALAEGRLLGRGPKRPRRRELGTGIEQARRDQRLDEIPLPAAGGREKRGHPHLPRRAHDRSDVAVGPGADDVERLVGRDQRVASHGAANQRNGRGREAGEIPEGFVLDLAGVAIGAPQEVIAIAPAPMRARDLGNVTGPGGARHTATLRGEPARCQALSWLHSSPLYAPTHEVTRPTLSPITLGYIYSMETGSFRHGDADLSGVLAGELRVSGSSAAT